MGSLFNLDGPAAPIVSLMCSALSAYSAVNGQPMQSNRNDYDIIFYDGECGLCHGLVRFILPRDKDQRFRFAPLQGETFVATIPAEQRGALPDSVVLRTASGNLLVRCDTVLYVLHQLGGFYKLLAGPLSLLPVRLREWAYNFIARRRKRWFAKPPAFCPVVPEELRSRFLP